ncbi:hypothetical protein N665_0230s0036 [Sinapis alba]|nr:hypothetical protein N665_0230s0036 [Sinapis alba]
MPMVVGCEEELTISDDDDLFVYLTSIDKENRRCLLLMEATSRSYQLEKLSRVGISSFGMNYEVLQQNDDEIRHNAIYLYVEDAQANQQKEVIEVENDDDTTRDECMDTDTVVDTNTVVDTTVDTCVDIAYKYVAQPPIEEFSQFIEE